MRAAIAAVALCAATAHAEDVGALERGTARFTAGDFAAAIEPLEAAHAAAPDDADTALLLGIAYYRTGRSDDARPLLEQAEARGDTDAKASARVFLGLIADAGGDSDRARSYFSLVADSPTELRASGKLLLDNSGPERWSAIAILRPGYDSNVALLPATAVRAGQGADADMTLIGALTGRPSLELPIVLDETIAYRKQAELSAYDMVSDSLGGTATFAGAHDRGTLAYHFEAALLGGTRYELGHVAEATYRHDAVGARYTFAARDYAQDAYTGYSGFEHTGVIEAYWHELSAGPVIDRDSTSDATLAATSFGGRADVRARNFRGSALVLDRRFDEMGRADVEARIDGAVFVDLSPSLGAVLGASFVRNASNTPDFDYTKWTVFAGLVIGTSS
jgi:tetratricopeptide (TPR) repeat protein